MKLIFIFIFISSFLYSKSIYEIKSIDKQAIKLTNIKEDKSNIQIGKSGFVISTYLQIEYISAVVVVKNISPHTITTKILKLNPFKKDYLAYANKKISKEDIVVFDLYRDNVFLIAPNKDAYMYMKSLSNFNGSNIVSPQMVISDIDLDDLSSIGYEHLVGDIYIGHSNTLTQIDAFSLKTINKQTIKIDSSNAIKPFFFYSHNSFDLFRVIDGWRGFNYDLYYKKLLEDIND